jgi:superfamily I DNA/RNA helicase
VLRLDLLNDLNPEQREAAVCDGHCLTVAAPGSGKTKMLSAKAAFLLSGGASVVAVTFTRDAAIELRDRIVRQAGEDTLPQLLVGTFHSIDLLMAFPARAKSSMGSAILAKSRCTLKTPWRIVRENSRRSAIARAVDVAGLALEVDEATSLVEKIKAGSLVNPGEREQLLAATYQDLLERHESIDFQDILLKTNEGLRSGHITPLAANYLLLDEFQDTDLTQFEWAMLHAQAGSVTTAVGDDDQSIYGFRRALGYEGMKMFQHATKAQRVVLGTNYRSHAEILSGAGRLIAINAERMDKALVSHKGAGGSAAWEKFANRSLEAAACADTAAAGVRQGASFGVLARTNARLDEVEAALRARGVPYVRAEGESLLETRELGVLVAAFTGLWAPSAKDTDELLAWCGAEEGDLAEIHRCFGAMVPAKLSRKVMESASFSSATRDVLRAVAKEHAVWASYYASGGIRSLVDMVRAFLVARSAGNTRSQRILDASAQMFWQSDANGMSGDQPQNQPQLWEQRGRSFAQRVADVRAAMGGSGRKDEGNKRDPHVTLMTAHGSKGLEFDQVWILGAEEESFPSKDSGLQEERRLMYVAMTRARKALWISASGKKAVSRFLDEAGVPRVADGTFKTQEG